MNFASPSQHEELLTPDESAKQLMNRLHTKPLKTGIRFLDSEMKFGFKTTDVVEVFGSSGSGKTEFLLNIAANCVMPIRIGDVEIGGLELGVLYFDNDLRFDPVRLRTLVQHRLAKHVKECSVVDLLLQQSLARFEVIQPQDSFQYQASLSYMTRVLQHDPRCKVLMVDSGSAFYFADRHSDEFPNRTSNRVVALLERLRVGRFCFLTKSQIRSGQSAEAKSEREYMGQKWEQLVRYRITLSKSPVHENFTARFTQTSSQPTIQPKEFRFRIDPHAGIVS